MESSEEKIETITVNIHLEKIYADAYSSLSDEDKKVLIDGFLEGIIDYLVMEKGVSVR